MNDMQRDAVWWLWTYQQYAIVPIAIAMTLGVFALMSFAYYAVPVPGHPRRRLWLKLGIGGIAVAMISAMVSVPVPVASCRIAASDPAILQALYRPWQKKAAGGTDTGHSTGLRRGGGRDRRSLGGKAAAVLT